MGLVPLSWHLCGVFVDGNGCGERILLGGYLSFDFVQFFSGAPVVRHCHHLVEAYKLL
jgi:hypothetical protein